MTKRPGPRIPRLDLRLKHALADRELDSKIRRTEQSVREVKQALGGPPVLIFNASTRIHRLSLNGAYALLAGWGLRLAGIDVRYVVCHQGMEQCILGTNPDDLDAAPPCRSCMDRSAAFFPAKKVLPLERDWVVFRQAAGTVKDMNLEHLQSWEFEGLPLGQLCLPGLRWALRRHHLGDDPPTRAMYRQYLASAASLAAEFDALIEESTPMALLVFNGIFYPEAVARAVARKRGVPVITHEVGLQPYSAYFSHADATFRDLESVSAPPLTREEDERLSRYLTDRRSGNFTMAGIRFWPEMQPLPSDLMEAMEHHARTVSIFTNVVFDTSQVHANVVFSDMFAWLNELKPHIRDHPEALFIIRAHPDEDRAGKASRESVADWYTASELPSISNVAFYGPGALIDSYELIDRSDAILTYNSSIGLEAAIMGKPVLVAGRARFSASGAVIAPTGRAAYSESLGSLLSGNLAGVPKEAVSCGQAFLYLELYRASLDLSEFLAPYPNAPGMVALSDFSNDELIHSEAIGTIVRGIRDVVPFMVRIPELEEELC